MEQTTLTREELYDLVWTTPVRQLAARFAISDVGLAKICKKHRIPRPPRGYWARLESGATVRRCPPPSTTVDALKTVIIQPRRRALAPGDPASPRPPAVVVPEVFSHPHPVVAAVERSLRGAKVDDRGILQARARRALDVWVGPASLDRASRILDALIKALEGQGAKVTTTGEGELKTAAVCGDVSVPFSLHEQLLRSHRELTPAEKREKERFPSIFRDPVVLSTTGKLALTIDVHDGDGARLRWADGAKQRLEACLTAFVEGVLRYAERVREERRAADDRRKKREEWERQRAEKLRLIHEEEERLNRLHAEADSFDRCRRVRRYIRHVVRTIEAAAGMPARPGSSLQKWADWATQHADRLDPAVKPPASILDEKAKWERAYWPG